MNTIVKAKDSLTYPFTSPPETGQVTKVAPGILWARIPLPFQLDHVNIYLIDDGDGWAVLDTGLGTSETRAVWEQLLTGPFKGRPLTRIIVSHFHPDHIGLAGWLSQRFDLPLLTSQTSYLGCINISLSPGALDSKPYHDFYLQHGLDPETATVVLTRGHQYLKLVTALPPTFRRLVAGDTLKIGGRDFLVLTGDGHAPEQVMLYCAAEKLFLAADQVLAKISPNVSVWAVEPEGDPLGLYLRSLKALKDNINEDALVLAGHQLPFYGLRVRIDELIKHHDRRCAAIADACRKAPYSAAELVPAIFNRQLDPHQMGFAFAEVQAHINYMLQQGTLAWVKSSTNVQRLVSI